MVLFSDPKLCVHRRWSTTDRGSGNETVPHFGSQHEAASYPDSYNTRLRTRNEVLFFLPALPLVSCQVESTMITAREKATKPSMKKQQSTQSILSVGCSPWWLLSALQMFYLCAGMACTWYGCLEDRENGNY